MDIFFKRRILKKLRDYCDKWDTEDYGYVQLTDDGKIIRTNNVDLGELTLTKIDVVRLIHFLDN